MIPPGIENAEEFPLAKWSETVQGLPKEQVAVLQEQLVQRVIAVINPGFGTSEGEWAQGAAKILDGHRAVVPAGIRNQPLRG